MSEFDVPGLGGVHHGYDEIREFWQGWSRSWADLCWDCEFYEREPFVVADIVVRGTGEASQITVELPHAQVLWFVRGRCMLHRMYVDRARGFEAAGLKAPEHHP